MSLKNKHNPAEANWLHHIKATFTSHILLKIVGFTLFISLFFVAYFHVLKHPAYPITLIPLSFVDNLISFQPIALPLYLSLWVYVGIPLVLMASKRELFEFTTAISLMCITGLAIFYYWPTTIAPANIDWRLHPSVSFLKSIDAAGNACPSLHVASAFFSGIWTARLLKHFKAPHWTRALNVIWGAGIIYSTLATRQHVALDVLGGLILGYIAILLVSITYWRRG
ncbi:MAG: phosphatase PAP2 family protein [Methylophilaceae bacterium]